jgi:hypothetical protein
MREVVFREQTHARPVQKLKSLFPGIRHAIAYKVSQRTLTFGTQPFLFDYFHQHHHEAFVSAVGKKRARNLEFSTAAAVVGVGEIVFLPADTLKILHQTNPGSLQGRSFFDIARQEGLRKLYRGALWTALRNAPGSFALFGGNALVKEQVWAHACMHRIKLDWTHSLTRNPHPNRYSSSRTTPTPQSSRTSSPPPRAPSGP